MNAGHKEQSDFAFTGLIEEMQKTADSAYEAAGSQIHSIFCAARKEVEQILNRQMLVQGIKGRSRGFFLRRLLFQLETQGGESGIVMDQIRRMLNH